MTTGIAYDLFWFLKGSPILRFSSFFMGMLGGILVAKAGNGIGIDKNYAEAAGAKLSMLCDLMPWKNTSNNLTSKGNLTKSSWTQTVDLIAILCILIQALVICCNSIRKLDSTYNTELAGVIFNNFGLANIVMPYMIAYMALMAIIGLCMDYQESIASKVLRTPIFVFFGWISYPLYILQAPVRYNLEILGQGEFIIGMNQPWIRFLMPILLAFIVKKTNIL